MSRETKYQFDINLHQFPRFGAEMPAPGAVSGPWPPPGRARIDLKCISGLCDMCFGARGAIDGIDGIDGPVGVPGLWLRRGTAAAPRL